MYFVTWWALDLWFSSSEQGSSTSSGRSREPDRPLAAAVVTSAAGVSKGKDPVVNFQECERGCGEEVDVAVFTSVDSYDDGEPSTFAGASHPPKPVDTDTFRMVYLPIEQSRPPDPPSPPSACLVKGLQQSAAASANGGPFSPARSTAENSSSSSTSTRAVLPLSPTESLVEEMSELGRPSSPFSIRRASRATTESTLAPPFGDTEQKEGVRDASLPPKQKSKRSDTNAKSIPNHFTRDPVKRMVSFTPRSFILAGVITVSSAWRAQTRNTVALAI